MLLIFGRNAMQRLFVEQVEARWSFAVDLSASQVIPLAYVPETKVMRYILGYAVSSGSGLTVGTIARTVASKDKVFGNADDVIVEIFQYADLPHGIDGRLEFRYPITSGIPAGIYYLGFSIDPTGKTAETNESNNTVFSDRTFTVGSPVLTDVTLVGTDSADTLSVTTSGTNLSTVRNGKTLQTIAISQVKSLTITGKAGNDVIAIDPTLPVNVTVDAGDGDDKVTSGAGADTLSGGAGKDTIYGGNGNDRLNGNGGNDRLYGESGGDRLYGYDGNDSLDGGSSNDQLDGGNGLDTLYGQGGDDRFYSKDSTVDQLFGGTGSDSAVLSDASDVKSSIEQILG